MYCKFLFKNLEIKFDGNFHNYLLNLHGCKSRKLFLFIKRIVSLNVL
jgi:hypothetical protein